MNSIADVVDQNLNSARATSPSGIVLENIKSLEQNLQSELEKVQIARIRQEGQLIAEFRTLIG